MKTSEMYLAAALLAYGADLEEVDKSDPNHKKFSFGGNIAQIFVLDSASMVLRIESPSFEDVKVKFVSQKLLFPASYVDSIRRIKAVIYD
ncbi:MAG: hypothetical protein ACW97P_04630 [Candidatus Hodarchaeales archaeon]|jgi:hypothetical protein